jgi:hypothetical protein
MPPHPCTGRIPGRAGGSLVFSYVFVPIILSWRVPADRRWARGGHAERACNDARRVALSGEATLPRTARQRQIGCFERTLRTREALARHHLVRAGTQRPSKQPGKVIGAVADLLRQDRQGELLTQLRADERQHLLDLALTQPGWGWASRPGTGAADRGGGILAHQVHGEQLGSAVRKEVARRSVSAVVSASSSRHSARATWVSSGSRKPTRRTKFKDGIEQSQATASSHGHTRSAHAPRSPARVSPSRIARCTNCWATTSR